MKAVRIGGTIANLGKSIGRGGEGDVYVITDQAHVAVKVYKEQLRGSREAKVRAMVDGGLADRTNLVAFPAAVATDSRGAFAGFTMRLVSGYRPIHQLYSPKSRRLEFPSTDYRFLVRAAQNVARAVATVHQSGCVIGDFNHSGVLVSKDATVALIDADSFQFTANGHSYPCVVGTEDFTPPELHGIHLASVERTRAHDHFGLAVAIFQLLAMGKHPYMGIHANHPDLSLGEAIAKHLFAYSIQRSAFTKTRPPPGSIQLSDFPAPLAGAFEAAFGVTPSGRPEPAVWVSLLSELERNLRQCSRISSHYFPHTASACIWCRLTGQSGVEMFPSTITPAPSAADTGFNIQQIATAIRSITLPHPDDLLPKLPSDLGPPSLVMATVQDGKGTQIMLGMGALILAIIGFVAAPQALLIWLAFCALGISRFTAARLDTKALARAFQDTDRRAHQLSEAHLRRVGFLELATLRAELESLVLQYQNLDFALNKELQRIRAGQQERQKHAFLDRILIERAKIPGIGQVKQRALTAFSIESAADISYAAVQQVPGFGEALTQKLLSWRAEQERKFRYSSTPTPADIQAEQAAHAAVMSVRTGLQAKLRSGLAALQRAPATLANRGSAVDPALSQTLLERARIARDCHSLGVSVPPHTPISLPIPRPASAPVVRFPPIPGVPATSMLGQAPSTRPIATARSSGTPSCPSCGSSMIRRQAHKGSNAGSRFWGCSQYPHCRGTRN